MHLATDQFFSESKLSETNKFWNPPFQFDGELVFAIMRAWVRVCWTFTYFFYHFLIVFCLVIIINLQKSSEPIFSLLFAIPLKVKVHFCPKVRTGHPNHFWTGKFLIVAFIILIICDSFVYIVTRLIKTYMSLRKMSHHVLSNVRNLFLAK